MRKQHLPQKICPACKRPFSWRKKWDKNWSNVNVQNGTSVLSI
ncbi:DUF2256 domain-containing protein [Tamlana fucoidanivorans]|uniref:DUF2256 domain-containing protein n=1 Tax=Allotamlana fucoidanivorans TaxID=2583814 RepID=A0A5C4SI40_9FLAO|nr:DUF2256 domain-containing protein [Tamlana fucoidanivorans]TNJ42452.1 DUF2256 domain-containing protein [Tamlana fucoidanivorans]